MYFVDEVLNFQQQYHPVGVPFANHHADQQHHHTRHHAPIVACHQNLGLFEMYRTRQLSSVSVDESHDLFERIQP